MTNRQFLSVGCIVILAAVIGLGVAPPGTGGGHLGAGWLTKLWTSVAGTPATVPTPADARPARAATPVVIDATGSAVAPTDAGTPTEARRPAGTAALVPVGGGPAASAADPSQADGAPIGEVALARAALSQVGTDPMAEVAWAATIDDPAVPADDRRALIEDLNQDGFSDPDHVTSADLPLITNRLAMIEDMGPVAMDAVNAAAFAEAYKNLLDMYDQASKN